MIEFRREIIITVLAAIFGGLVNHFIPVLFSISDSEISLEYAPIYKDAFINVPDTLNGSVIITVRDKKVSNISSVDVHLFNRSDKPLKNISLTFEIDSKDIPHKPVLLGKLFSRPETLPKETITEIKSTDVNLLKYKISTFPPSDGYDTNFVVTLFFVGDQSPKIKVQSDYVDGKYINIYEFDEEKRDRKVLIVVFLIIGLFIWWLIWQGKKDRERLLNKIELSAKEILSKTEEVKIDKELVISLARESYEKATERKSIFKKI